MKKRIYKLTSVILVFLLLASCIHKTPKNESSIPAAAEKKWVLGKADIPENNPEPVVVNREDAATPTPISFTDKIVKNKMNLDVKLTENGSTELDEYGSHIAILNSYDEFAGIWQQDEKSSYDLQKSNYEKYTDYPFDENEYYINWYTEDFFKDNTLVMLLFSQGSGAISCKIDYVASENGRMHIYVNNTDLSKGDAYTCDMNYIRAFISVPKKDMKNIKDIVVYEDELYVD